MQERKFFTSGYATAVGAFVVGAVLFLFVCCFLLRDDTPKYDLSVEFNSINNLAKQHWLN